MVRSNLGPDAARSPERVLLMADRHGHLIERIAHAWASQASGVQHEVMLGEGNTAYSRCIRAAHVGLVHWLDHIAFEVIGPAVSVPQVVMVHHLTPADFSNGIATLRYADALTTASVRWKRKLEAATSRSVALIPYSVDTTVFRILKDREHLRKAAGIPDGAWAIGFLGKARANQHNRKGLDLLASVCTQLSHIKGPFVLVLVGPGWDDLADSAFRPHLPVIRLQYSDTTQTREAYALMDSLVVTSSEEGGPCTILEAMACGVPVITSDVGHVPELITQGVTGFICDREPADYIRSLLALRADLHLRKNIALQARLFVEQHRDDRVVVPKVDFCSIYRSAEARFITRTRADRMLRVSRRFYWGVRHVCRRAVPCKFKNRIPT